MGGSWTKAAQFIRACGVVVTGSKLTWIELDYREDDGEAKKNTGDSRMCLYSIWGVIRTIYWDVEDNKGTTLSESKSFSVHQLHLLVETVHNDKTKMVSRQFMIIYGDELIRGGGLDCSNKVVKEAVKNRMNMWADENGHAKKDWWLHFTNMNLHKLVICCPLGEHAKGDTSNKDMRIFMDKFDGDLDVAARPRLVKLRKDFVIQMMKLYRYGVHEGQWKPADFSPARFSDGLLRYMATADGILNGLTAHMPQSDKKRFIQVENYGATHEGLENMKQTAIADRYFQWIVEKSIGDGGDYHVTTGEIDGSDEYVEQLEREWNNKVREEGGAPNFMWIRDQFGHLEKPKYNCDIGYLYTKINHTTQSMHVDYLRRMWQKKNWVGFVPLSETGMYVQIWAGRPTREHGYTASGYDNRQQGTVMFIPCGMAMFVRGDTVHAGGMHCDSYRNKWGNPRLHVYIKQKEGGDVGFEKNGNQWHDYDSGDTSDKDSEHKRAVRKYPAFLARRKNNELLGYAEDVRAGEAIRKGNNFSKVLFSDMKLKEALNVALTGREARKLQSTKQEIVEEVDLDKKPAAKKKSESEHEKKKIGMTQTDKSRDNKKKQKKK